jgi:chromosome partitioning protein
MILAVGNVKGGVGKTTLAVNIAIALTLSGREVLLVDGDEQATALEFTELRTSEKGGKSGYTAVGLQGTAIRTQVRQLAPKYDDNVIDVGGRDTGSLRAALTVANMVLIPVKPRSFDLWGVDQTAELVREAREVNDLRAIVVLNEADAQGKDNDAALEALKEVEGLELAPVLVVRRKAFPNAAAVGLSVLEYDDPKARDELNQLMEILYKSQKDIGVLSYGNR